MDRTDGTGDCLIIPPDRQVPDLSAITVQTPSGDERQTDWNDRTSALLVLTNPAHANGLRCDTFLHIAIRY